ncbi:dicarboxylate/amino acid:cation symporter [Maledivibacter halophilus]|uniref:Na+/H+-dicarboxylate symporter n=1 Tax=Maledivibacter halophilus TaxID=36842 RepID=A0A1T5MWN4_9FIRM|nr:dicarboxylate/amino acid:cation symporter [Maledivibacter halophilus]SKC92612.1 Na+/H+-dicarboxylate symporter [Maledivibacter halophilus]
MKWWINQKLYVKIFICIVIGIILGFALGPNVTVIKPIGDVFIRLLKMLIVPLTFFTLISGINKMDDLKSLRSVGGKTILYYCLTSLFAGTVGVIVALILKPGKEVIGLLDQGAEVTVAEYNFIDNMVQWIPTNPIEAMANANMLQVIVFSIIVGIALLKLGDKTKLIVSFIDKGADVMIEITDFVMKLAPYGILALIANMVGTLGSKMLAEVGRFILTDIVGIICVLVFVYPLILKFVGKVNPLRFYRNISPAMLVAASTTSSAATLPISMQVAGKNNGVPEKIYGFTLPLGATVNMDGMAVAIGCISVFSANLYGVPITGGLIFQFMFLGLVLSIGAAGVKGAGIVMSTVLLQTLNMPLTLVPILAAIWPIIDIGHTTTNVTGDLTGTTIIASNTNSIDMDVFNSTSSQNS